MHAPIIAAGTLALLTLAGAALAGSAVAQSYGSQGQGWQQQQPAYGNQQGAPTGSYGQQGGSYDNQQQRDRDQYRQGAGPATQPGNRPRNDQRSARGDLAVDVDTALQARGYDVGVIDGKLDAQSRAAIRGYERTAGLAVTGEPSQALLAHIESHGIRAGNPAPQSETLGSAAGQAVDRFLKPNTR